MTFEEEMKNIEEFWANESLPPEFIEIEANTPLCSVNGVLEQLQNLPIGQGSIKVAYAKDGNIEIKTLAVVKQ
jgi:hypothetical protein